MWSGAGEGAHPTQIHVATRCNRPDVTQRLSGTLGGDRHAEQT